MTETEASYLESISGTVDPEIYFDDDKTEVFTATEVIDQILKIGAWAAGSAARRAVVQIKIQGDSRPIAEVARDHRVDSSAVYRALAEYEECLTGDVGFCSSLTVGRKRVTKRRKTNSAFVEI